MPIIITETEIKNNFGFQMTNKICWVFRSIRDDDIKDLINK